MSRRSLSALVVSATLLAGCGTGLHSRTYQEHGREDGASADLGGLTGVAVRGLHVAGPDSGPGHVAGSTAYVTGALVNHGTSTDALIGASSAVAGAVSLLVDGTPTTQVAIPSGGTAPTTWSIALSNLVTPLPVAAYVPVTLLFQRAGRVTLQVPVYSGDNGLSTRKAEQEPYEVK